MSEHTGGGLLGGGGWLTHTYTDYYKLDDNLVMYKCIYMCVCMCVYCTALMSRAEKLTVCSAALIRPNQAEKQSAYSASLCGET